MKRQKFLGTLLAAATMPLAGRAMHLGSGQRTDKGFKVPRGKGRLHGHITLKGINQNVLDVKVSGSDTNGSLAVFEQTSLSQGKGTPYHVHHNQDEMFYVVEGEYFFKVGTKEFELQAGDSIFLPMKVPHAWTQRSASGKMTVTFAPAGKMESFFIALAAAHQPTPADIAKLFADNDMQIVGAPLPLK